MLKLVLQVEHAILSNKYWTNVWNKALFYSYSVIGSHSRLFPAIKRPAKISLPNVDYFSTWQFDLYDKSDGNPSEI